MFLGSYEFDGQPAELLAAYQRLLQNFPPDSLDLHVSVVRDDGITVFDACPSRAAFDDFSQSPEFLGAVESAGLPRPSRVAALGEIHRAQLRQPVHP
jgi:hypothetical protein